ncbi:uncharacterized protein LOC133740143 [Rosa rugosa]|uniref:uncharacterized protein LOC133740143 n=1 Tax=Rosa rugosa TaxID=74645 RepID=UPI002B410D2C|nr:uncharacterized protein LOC133740143 [Rosa rugosa]
MQKLGFPSMRSLDQFKSLSKSVSRGPPKTFAYSSRPQELTSSGSFANLKLTAGFEEKIYIASSLRDMQGYSFDKQVKIAIVTMALHNYIRRHAHGDRHFVRSEEREGYGSSGGIEMDDDVEEEYHGHGAQEMETIRNNITQSLMNVRNNVNI